MSIAAIAALNAASAGTALSSAAMTKQTAPVFDSVVEGIAKLNAQLKVNDQAVQSMALGDSVSLHETMMNLERTRLTFDLMLQVRNKLLDAYQELTRMQV
jgi:flagellar hook-basal body complex protein FliE